MILNCKKLSMNVYITHLRLTRAEEVLLIFRTSTLIMSMQMTVLWMSELLFTD